MAVLKGIRTLRLHGYARPWDMSPLQILFDVELLREDRRRERIHNAMMIRTMTLEGVEPEAIQAWMDRTA